PRTFLLDDWWRREGDVLVRLPFRTPGQSDAVLVCVLVEHQSKPDPAMPLRVLLYAVLHWDQEWRAWEKHHEPDQALRQALRLTPVVPVVWHPGPGAWNTNRRLADLFHAPEPLQAHLPHWPMSLTDLAEQTPEALLQTAEAWWQALAVVRADREDAAHFA